MTRGIVATIGLWIERWTARLVLALFVLLTAYTWLDVLVLQPEEYERLIGGEAGCGKFRSYCSWRAFVLDSVPDFILSVLAVIGMAWRGVPRRELILNLMAVTICGYLGWRAYSTHVEAILS